jgi:hypothetical protein
MAKADPATARQQTITSTSAFSETRARHEKNRENTTDAVARDFAGWTSGLENLIFRGIMGVFEKQGLCPHR